MKKLLFLSLLIISASLNALQLPLKEAIFGPILAGLGLYALKYAYTKSNPDRFILDNLKKIEAYKATICKNGGTLIEYGVPSCIEKIEVSHNKLPKKNKQVIDVAYQEICKIMSNLHHKKAILKSNQESPILRDYIKIAELYIKIQNEGVRIRTTTVAFRDGTLSKEELVLLENTSEDDVNIQAVNAYCENIKEINEALQLKIKNSESKISTSLKRWSAGFLGTFSLLAGIGAIIEAFEAIT